MRETGVWAAQVQHVFVPYWSDILFSFLLWPLTFGWGGVGCCLVKGTTQCCSEDFLVTSGCHVQTGDVCGGDAGAFQSDGQIC